MSSQAILMHIKFCHKKLVFWSNSLICFIAVVFFSAFCESVRSFQIVPLSPIILFQNGNKASQHKGKLILSFTDRVNNMNPKYCISIARSTKTDHFATDSRISLPYSLRFF